MRRTLATGILTLAILGLTADVSRADVVLQIGGFGLRIGCNTPNCIQIAIPTRTRKVMTTPVPAPAPGLPVAPPPGLPLEIAPPASGVPQVVPQALPGPALTPSVSPAPSATIVTPAPLARPLSVREFASVFKPVCGSHQVMLVHPFTGCPVQVCFNLPNGCPKVKVHFRRELEFNYGRQGNVEIHFDRSGRTWVEYHK